MTQRIDTLSRPTRGYRSHRGRRLAVALALAGAVATGLTACQVQPGAAGFVGSDRITQSQVETVYQSVSHLVPDSDIGAARQQVAQLLVVRALAQRVAREQGVTVGPVDYGQYARSINLPASNAFVRLDAETQTALAKLSAALPPVNPGESEYRAIYQSRAAAGINEEYGRFRAEIKAVSGLGSTVAVQRALNAASHRYDAQLNPRYGKPVFGLPVKYQGSTIGTLPVRLGDGSKNLVVSPANAGSGLANGS